MTNGHPCGSSTSSSGGGGSVVFCRLALRQHAITPVRDGGGGSGGVIAATTRGRDNQFAGIIPK